MPQHKALILSSKGSAFTISTVETPKPAPGDLLVKIVATALNPVDWKMQKFGLFIDAYPAIPGSDSAGIVEEVGEGVTTFKKGDRVLHQGFNTNDKSTFQEYTTVPAEIAAKIPNNLSFDQAATVPLGLATASVGFYNAKEKGGAGLTPPWEADGAGKYEGKGLFILGGASSVGQYAIQLAHFSGFSPIVTTASLHNSHFLKSLGATHVIDRNADIVSEACKILPNAPCVVYDTIGGEDTQQQGWKVLAPNGQLLSVARTSPGIKDGEDGKSAIGVFGSMHRHRDLGKSLYAKLTGLLASGTIKPNRVEVILGGLAGIEAGLKRLQEKKVSGQKLVVMVGETA